MDLGLVDAHDQVGEGALGDGVELVSGEYPAFLGRAGKFEFRASVPELFSVGNAR